MSPQWQGVCPYPGPLLPMWRPAKPPGPSCETHSVIPTFYLLLGHPQHTWSSSDTTTSIPCCNVKSIASGYMKSLRSLSHPPQHWMFCHVVSTLLCPMLRNPTYRCSHTNPNKDGKIFRSQALPPLCSISLLRWWNEWPSLWDCVTKLKTWDFSCMWTTLCNLQQKEIMILELSQSTIDWRKKS